MKENQRDLNSEHYLSEDNVTCTKGKTEAYILVKESLSIYGPKMYKFGEPHLNYYFQRKSNAEIYKQQLLKFKEEQMLGTKTKVKKLTGKGLFRSKMKHKTVPVQSKPVFKEEPKVYNITEQIKLIKSKIGFDKWLKNNKLKLDLTFVDDTFQILLFRDPRYMALIDMKSKFSQLPHCCGGYENGSHSGSHHIIELPGFTMDHFRILAKYIAQRMDIALKANAFKLHGKYIITFIKSPGDLSVSSAKWGEIFKRSKYFKKVGEFTNTTKSNLDVYVSTQAYVNLYKV